VNDRELDLRRRIFVAFAETGEPPPLRDEDPAVVEALVDRHVIVLDGDGEVRMAHPFAAHDEGATVTANGRTWRGNCAWDAFGIAAALNLTDPVVESNGVTADETTLFHVEVPAARWWDDPAYT
jgi:Alkylmercury lyase